MRKEKEIERIIENSSVVLPLEFVIKIMKVLEIANESLQSENETEQEFLTGSYANTLFHEVGGFITGEELVFAEENEMIGEL